MEAQEPLRNLARSVHRLFLLERIDRIDGGEEPHLLAMMFEGLNAERDGDVDLACSRRSALP